MSDDEGSGVEQIRAAFKAATRLNWAIIFACVAFLGVVGVVFVVAVLPLFDSGPDGATLFIRDCHHRGGTVYLALDSADDLCKLP